MTLLFVILIVIATVVLSLIVLVQNPKGGGLAGTFGGISNQFMGVKQTNDVLEKGTWIFSAIIGALCLLSSLFIGGTTGPNTSTIDNVGGKAATPTQQQAPAPAPITPGQQAPAPQQ
ncbi:preprotein translocase subunit SecG [Nostoc ellipsosporum NOK]|jgi:preprotein translocase subunit SecG|nr:preprotein translocase subunit SecG [Nostoc ellipsosporum NOK]